MPDPFQGTIPASATFTALSPMAVVSAMLSIPMVTPRLARVQALLERKA